MSPPQEQDLPYTSPDEDPFHVAPLLPYPRRRRSSMLDKWIQDQQYIPSPAPSCSGVASSSPSNAYLAYPDLSLRMPNPADDVATVYSYDLVDDADIPEEEEAPPQPPLTPVTSRTRRHSRHRYSPSFRSFSISFRSSLHSSPPSPNKTPSRRISRISIFTRSPRLSTSTLASSASLASPVSRHPPQHNKSASLSATDVAHLQSSRSPKSCLAGAGSTSKWRPTVLGHFSQLPVSPSSSGDHSSTFFTPSRPSISSADTSNTHQSSALTATTTPESQPPTTPTKPSFIDSLRFKSRSRTTMFKSHPTTDSSSSLFSQNNIPERPSMSDTSCSSHAHLPGTLSPDIPFAPNLGSHPDLLDDLEDDEEEDDVDDLPGGAPNDSTIKSARPSALGTLSRVGLASLSSRRHKKKRRLVVSGVGVREVRKFDGVKQWCESFGEVKQINRMPNGDLHVDFRSSDVADTVCRLKAGVYISGVGRVQLSWFTGDKR